MSWEKVTCFTSADSTHGFQYRKRCYSTAGLTEPKLIHFICVLGEVEMRNVDQEVGVLGEGVYKYVRPETLKALHYYMGVGGADRFLSFIPVEHWEDADGLAAAHVQQFCKCAGSGCVACQLMSSIHEKQADEAIPDDQ